MSHQNAFEPVCTTGDDSIELVIEPKAKDLGGFSVRRVLPSPRRRMVGPFVFLDHMGPAEFPPGKGIAVRPHPHIGLATVTYLFEGEIMHRDSLGYSQAIQPGAVNLMTAGKGIVHSERAGDDLDTTSRLHGLQSWMALPAELEEREPDFVHYPAGELPVFDHEGVTVTVIIGEALGRKSPVLVDARTLYLELRMPAGKTFDLPASDDDIGVYVIEGEVRCNNRQLTAGRMAVRGDRASLTLDAGTDTHAVIIGGEALGKRHIWWNFVSSRRERIEQGKRDWQEGRFDAVPGETEFIPLPD